MQTISHVQHFPQVVSFFFLLHLDILVHLAVIQILAYFPHLVENES